MLTGRWRRLPNAFNRRPGKKTDENSAVSRAAWLELTRRDVVEHLKYRVPCASEGRAQRLGARTRKRREIAANIKDARSPGPQWRPHVGIVFVRPGTNYDNRCGFLRPGRESEAYLLDLRRAKHGDFPPHISAHGDKAP